MKQTDSRRFWELKTKWYKICQLKITRKRTESSKWLRSMKPKSTISAMRRTDSSIKSSTLAKITKFWPRTKWCSLEISRKRTSDWESCWSKVQGNSRDARRNSWPWQTRTRCCCQSWREQRKRQRLGEIVTIWTRPVLIDDSLDNKF